MFPTGSLALIQDWGRLMSVGCVVERSNGYINLSPILAVQKYNEDDLPAYTPMPWSLKEIRAAVPAKFFVRDIRRGLLYLARDLLLATVAWSLAAYIDPFFSNHRRGRP
ncbi:hypothetical protein BD779DRAFT_1553550 [Infundibulicybe gibba]|nr:hypothetical protein BD779DRAFT_1553550 [Infundibulicybe gibba]